jgi:hypothetical protein
MSCRTSCCKKLSIIFALLALAVLAAPAFAQTCLKDEYGKNVQCTANDVRVAFADNPRALDGSPLTSCVSGTTFNFVADFHVVTTATARENIGLYFATNGQSSALTGTCSDNIIAPLHKSSNPLDTVTLGTSQYEELDTGTPTDTCGDISTSDNNQVITVEVDNAKCVAGANGLLALPDCTSWQQPGGTILCVSPAPNYPWVKAAIPGSPSKCNCDNGFTVPITVQSPQVAVTKNCTTANGSGTLPTPSCTLTDPDGAVTYTVDIANQSTFGDIIVDQICDTAYGTVFQVGGFAGPPCAPGSVANAPASTTCSALDIPSGTDKTCTFTATQAENVTVKNIVSVTGHGASAGTFGPNSSNQVTVTSNEAPSSATITKSLVNTTAGCATVRYGVDVKNTSGADETLTLSALTDSAYGSIIPNTSANVIATTCAVPQTLAPSADYTCTFDATFCGGLDSSGCFSHTNTVSATVTGDEGETVTVTNGALTLKECLTSTPQ